MGQRIFTILSATKKAFTLFELLIVIVLVGVLYYFAISKFNIKQNEFDKVNLLNLKSYLLNKEFNEKVVIKCIDDAKKCYVFLDDVVENKKEPLEDLFKSKPEIYEYSKDLNLLDLGFLEIDDIPTGRIDFELTVYKNKKSSEFILEYENKTYLFNSIYDKPVVLKNINDIYDMLENNINEVKDAF